MAGKLTRSPAICDTVFFLGVAFVGDTSTVHSYGRGATSRCASACFEASYQRQNELTKQDTKQTAADHLQAENEARELS
eukprot:1908724-Pleurochrysis_carterae.AAC.1